MEHVEAEDPPVHQTEPCRVHELQRHSHLQCGFPEFPLLEHSPRLLQVSVRYRSLLAYIRARSSRFRAYEATDCRHILGTHVVILLDRDVVIRYVTILAPYDSPNTDGIDPGK